MTSVKEKKYNSGGSLLDQTNSDVRQVQFCITMDIQLKMLLAQNLLIRGPFESVVTMFLHPRTRNQNGHMILLIKCVTSKTMPSSSHVSGVLKDKRKIKKIVRMTLPQMLFFGKKGREKELSSHGVRITCRA